MTDAKRILYCHCSYYDDVLPEEVKSSVVRVLSSLGVPFDPVPDLCGLAARRDPTLKAVASGGPAAVLACHPRAVRWLFDCAGAPLPETGVELLDMRSQPASEITEKLLEGATCASGGCACNASLVESLLVPEPGSWVPWFPVIDYDRCIGCRQCLEFCLFGVFGVDDSGRVVVEHPEKCKTNCPVCARVCPEVAIMFPKYASPPINGAEVTAEDAAREPVKVDLASILAGDVHAKLRARSGAGAPGRFAEGPDREQAEQERRRCSCMGDLLERLGVEPDVAANALREKQQPPSADDADCADDNKNEN